MTERGGAATTPGEREVWRVDDLLIDVGRQRVTRGDIELELPRLSFDLLLALVRHAPDVVSGDDLMTLVWPGLVVGPETITQRVKLLRQALGDRTDNPRYVAALRGRGYRLVPVAERVASPAVTPPTSTSISTSNPQPLSRWRAPALALAALVAAALLAYSVLQHREDAATGAEQHPALPAPAASKPTVAVLPFENFSADPADAFLSKALPEVASNRLARVRGLTVIARESTAHATRTPGSVQEIGLRLGATYLVGGSVHRSGVSLRVSARLIEAATGTELWAREIDGGVADLFQLQDQLTDEVAAALRSRVSNLALETATSPRSANVEAYLAYLRGRTLAGRFTVAEAEAAATEFERAIALDPTFAAAHAALYDARMQAAGLQHGNLDDARARYRPTLDTALSLDPGLGAAQFALAMWEDLTVGERESAYRRAIAGDPGNTRGLVAFSEFLDATDGAAEGARVPGSGFDPTARLARGRSATAVENGGARAAEAGRVLEEALRIDPLSTRALFRQAMREFRATGADVEAPILRILEVDPEYYPALQRVAKYRAMLHGHPAEAIGIIEHAIRNDPRNPWAPHTATAFYLDAGDPEGARAVAATTPVSAITTRTLLAQYAGDWQAAGRAAMEPRAFEFGFNESWGVAEALRDYALRSGDLAGPMRRLRDLYRLPEREPLTPTVATFRASVQLAHLELLAGQREIGHARLRAVIRWVDADLQYRSAFKRRARAQALMLLGETELALADLAASFREDRDYNQWWYTTRHDPLWDPVRADPRFVAIDADAAAFARREADLVQQMRDRGEIPRRDAGARPVTVK